MSRLSVAFNWYKNLYDKKYEYSPARFLADALQKYLGDVTFVGGPSSVESTLLMRLYYHYLYLIRANYMADSWKYLAKARSRALNRKLKTGKKEYDVIISWNTVGLSYLNTNIPLFIYNDAVFASCVNYYESHTNKRNRAICAGNQLEKMALAKAKCVILSSQWSISDAQSKYDIKVNYESVAIGANLRNLPSNITSTIPPVICTLLFISSRGSWERKGGDIAYKTTKLLNKMGLKTVLQIIGDFPEHLYHDKENVELIAYLNKNLVEDMNKYYSFLAEASYNILPTKVDFTPHTIAESNAFGTPVVASAISGIPEMVKDGISGLLLPANSTPEAFADKIFNNYQNKKSYSDMRKQARLMYERVLNWDTSAQKIAQIVERYMK